MVQDPISSPAQPLSPCLSCSAGVLCSACLCLISWLDFGPVLPGASLQPCPNKSARLRNKTGEGDFFPPWPCSRPPTDGQGGQAPALLLPLQGMLPGTRVGGSRVAPPAAAALGPPFPAESRGGSAGGGTRLGSAGSSSLPPSPDGWDVSGCFSPPPHPPLSFFPRLPNLTVNAACFTRAVQPPPPPPPPVARYRERGDVAGVCGVCGGVWGSRLPSLPLLRQGAASPAPHRAWGGEGCCIWAGVA